jgi:hypothetical protein
MLLSSKKFGNSKGFGCKAANNLLFQNNGKGRVLKNNELLATIPLQACPSIVPCPFKALATHVKFALLSSLGEITSCKSKVRTYNLIITLCDLTKNSS